NVQPRLLSESDLYAEPGFDHHRHVSEPARSLDAGHEAARRPAYGRRRFPTGGISDRTRGEGAFPTSEIDGGISFAGSLSDASGSRILAAIPRTVLRIRPCGACAQPYE